MEGRVPPSTEESTDDPPQPSLTLTNNKNNNDGDSATNQHVHLSPDVEVKSETYVIQIPKEIIYRVPPPENAAIIERYRSPTKTKRSNYNCGMCIVIALALIALIVGASIAIWNKVINPEPPLFSIEKVVINKHKNMHLGFEIGLNARNPNKEMGFSNDGNEIVHLKRQEIDIGKGKFPELKQDGDSSNDVHLSLTGSNATILEDDHQVMNKSKHSITLKLDFHVVMKIDFATFNIGSKETNVVCTFKMLKLRDTFKLDSQKCLSQFKSS